MASKPISQERIDAVTAAVSFDGTNLVRLTSNNRASAGDIVHRKADGKYNIEGAKYSPRQVAEILGIDEGLLSANDAGEEVTLAVVEIEETTAEVIIEEAIQPEDSEPKAESNIDGDILSETAQITNSDFLSAIFAGRDPESSVVFCRFPGDPHKRKSWSHSVWLSGDIEGGENTYFALASVKPDKDGKLGRRKENFSGLHCVMLDDIGGKVSEELPLDPSWLIETSPGNHQAGYIFAEPLGYADGDALMKALTVAKRLTDTGGQNIVRWARLPVGINGKATLDEPFDCRLKSWNPETRYSLAELVSGLSLDLEPHRSTRKSKKTRATTPQHDAIYTPKAESNPVIAEMVRLGLYKRDLGNGKHQITCPWANEHTDDDDSGTVYFEPDDNYMRGGFRCHHGHCSDRHTGEFLSVLGVTDHEARHKPTFYVAGGTLHVLVNNAERVMAEDGRFFEQGGAIVSVVTPDGGRTTAKHIRKDALPTLLTGMASWLRYDARSESWVAIDAPTKVCSGLFELPEYRHIPPLVAIARQPYLRADGSVVMASGYDKLTKTYGVFDAAKFRIIENPTQEQVDAAKERILDLIEESAFATEADKSAAVAGFLTGAVRPSLPVAPGFLHNAHAPGSGKSYLQDINILFATDGGVSSATYKLNDDEMEKTILAIYLQSPAVVRFDEAQGDIVPIKFLTSAITSERVSGRILGQSKVVEPSTRSLHLFAGNNIAPVGDMLRRIVVCNLDAKVENPESREFKGDPLTKIRKNREAYVSDALTLICGQIRSGTRTECRVLNGFPLWDSWVRQTVLGLGLPDPCLSMFAAATIDPNTEKLAELMEVWNKCFSDYPKAARDAIKYSEGHQELRTILLEVAGKSGVIDSTRLGYWLKRYEGKVVNGRRFMRDEAKSSSAKYILKTIAAPATADFADFFSAPGTEDVDVIESEDFLTNFSSGPEKPTTPTTPTPQLNTSKPDVPSRSCRTNRAVGGPVEKLSEDFSTANTSDVDTSVPRVMGGKAFLAGDRF